MGNIDENEIKEFDYENVLNRLFHICRAKNDHDSYYHNPLTFKIKLDCDHKIKLSIYPRPYAPNGGLSIKVVFKKQNNNVSLSPGQIIALFVMYSKDIKKAVENKFLNGELDEIIKNYKAKNPKEMTILVPKSDEIGCPNFSLLGKWNECIEKLGQKERSYKSNKIENHIRIIKKYKDDFRMELIGNEYNSNNNNYIKIENVNHNCFGSTGSKPLVWLTDNSEEVIKQFEKEIKLMNIKKLNIFKNVEFELNSRDFIFFTGPKIKVGEPSLLGKIKDHFEETRNKTKRSKQSIL